MVHWNHTLFSYPKDGERRRRQVKDMAEEGRKTRKMGRKMPKTYSHGNYTLLTLQHSLCHMLFGRRKVRRTRTQLLAHTVRRKRTATVTSSNGVLTASEAKHCQKAGPKKAHALSEPGSSNSAILSQLTLSGLGLPLFQEQDIMYFYYACHYHSAHLCF